MSRRLSRGGKKIRPAVPERRCIATRESLPKPGLLRFTIDPEGAVTPDIAKNLPGRGIWVRADRGSLETAIRGNLFARAACKAVRVPEDLVEIVEAGLLNRVSGLLSLARKSGQALAGFDKAAGEIAAGRAVLLLQASDASPRQADKLRRRANAVKCFTCLTGNELGMAFGRRIVIHAVLLNGGFAKLLSCELRRLAGIRSSQD
ncbi:MAG: RNA-binding protein [Rhodobacteraceae bacterium]|nr:RNA-binding protein [Paracoccaceae bacterium]